MPDRLPIALTRSLAITAALARDALSFSELRARLDGLAAPTLSRLLRALSLAGYIVKRERAYALAPRLQAVARQVAGGIEAHALVEPALNELALATGDSAAFYRWETDRLILVAKREMPESFRYIAIGGPVVELTRHGFAQAILARLSEAERRRCWRICPEREARPLHDFLARIAIIRRDAIAIERGEHRPGVTRIAAAVGAGAGGRIVGAIGVSSLAPDAERTRLTVQAVRRAADAATAALACRGESPP